ncbi:hypothetical protein [Spiroplasma endosymbiont of Phyllotreta cruciferae]|uniref:hypothetical protein n=1 Tax=Spiroplasma endosymbiont of Phyllotreta cruciferae TaxID=2886375 RepID=UPI00209E1643|nr:hypothetical protein [Spiroplasma endosymbiont of Phyllotreta cruciferae]
MNNEQIELLWTNLKKQDNKVMIPLTKFHGYQQMTDNGTVVALFNEAGHPVEQLNGVGLLPLTILFFMLLVGAKFQILVF